MNCITYVSCALKIHLHFCAFFLYFTAFVPTSISPLELPYKDSPEYQRKVYYQNSCHILTNMPGKDLVRKWWFLRYWSFTRKIKVFFHSCNVWLGLDITATGKLGTLVFHEGCIWKSKRHEIYNNYTVSIWTVPAVYLCCSGSIKGWVTKYFSFFVFYVA